MCELTHVAVWACVSSVNNLLEKSYIDVQFKTVTTNLGLRGMNNCSLAGYMLEEPSIICVNNLLEKSYIDVQFKTVTTNLGLEGYE